MNNRYPYTIRGRLATLRTSVMDRVRYRLLERGQGVVIGRGCNFKPGVVAIGSATFIGPGCVVRAPTDIGSYVMLARNVTIAGDDHPFDQPGVPMILGSRPVQRRVKIGDDVWVGSNATILAGATIGSGSIIGANALVVGSVASNSIVVAPQATAIRARFEDDEDWRTHLEQVEDMVRQLR